MRRALLLNFCLLVVTIFIFLAFFEFILYLSGYNDIMSGNIMRLGDLTEEYGYETILDEHLVTYWGKKNFSLVEDGVAYQLNSQGFREREISFTKPAGVSRVVFLGDSVTFGKGVDANASYVSLLAQKFNSSQIQFINLGMTGLSTFEEYIILRDEGIRYDPDLVVIGYVLNDPYVHTGADSTSCAITLLDLAFPCSWKYALLQIRVVHFVRSHLQSLFYSDADLAAYWADLHHNSRYINISHQSLYEISQLGLQQDFKVLLVIFPLYNDFNFYYWTDVHTQVLAEANSLGFATLDLLPAYSSYDASSLRWKPSDISHPNEKGHEIAANALYVYLTEQNMTLLQP